MMDDTRPVNGVMAVLLSHRSVRSFTDEPIDEATLRNVIEAGTRASTSSNMQPYTVIWMTDPGLRKKVAACCADQKQIHDSAAFLACCADLHKLRLACAQHGVETDAAGLTEALLVAVVDTALVMQNMAVAAESMGYGICMIGAMRNQPAEVARLLRLPEHVFAVAGLCIGRPADAGDIKPRLGLDATLHVNGYRPDEELQALMSEYDTRQSAWYAERGMHVSDGRWTAVMAKRLPGVRKREALGRFLQARGLMTE